MYVYIYIYMLLSKSFSSMQLRPPWLSLFRAPYRFPVFCAIVAFGGAQSLYSVSCISLTKLLLQYCSGRGHQTFDGDLYVYSIHNCT